MTTTKRKRIARAPGCRSVMSLREQREILAARFELMGAATPAHITMPLGEVLALVGDAMRSAWNAAALARCRELVTHIEQSLVRQNGGA
jgi:hypothetical protein